MRARLKLVIRLSTGSDLYFVFCALPSERRWQQLQKHLQTAFDFYGIIKELCMSLIFIGRSEGDFIFSTVSKKEKTHTFAGKNKY